ncbi:MAG: 16S rRNA (cytosine(1402)-N(4))-methyltransferase RsmH [Putridiphycobacter sp.]
MTNNTYHVPVLFQESIDALKIEDGKVFVDVTFGGGGHSTEILRRMSPDATLMAFDQDDDALNNIPDDERLIFVNSNFRFLRNFVKYYEFNDVDAILADLGVSSHQFDEIGRGFSIRSNAKLDMRMNQNADLTAFKIVNNYSDKELYRIFNAYADLKNTNRVVPTIIKARKLKPIETTFDLVDLLKDLVKGKKQNQFLAQVFQAIRIEVNDEMGALEDMLTQAAEVLKPGGRLVVIAYHSIEDRLVKNFIRSGRFDGKIETDIYGNIDKPLSALNKKPIIPTDQENEQNSRARSAKMRIAIKNG